MVSFRWCLFFCVGVHFAVGVIVANSSTRAFTKCDAVANWENNVCNWNPSHCVENRWQCVGCGGNGCAYEITGTENQVWKTTIIQNGQDDIDLEAANGRALKVRNFQDKCVVKNSNQAKCWGTRLKVVLPCGEPDIRIVTIGEGTSEPHEEGVTKKNYANDFSHHYLTECWTKFKGVAVDDNKNDEKQFNPVESVMFMIYVARAALVLSSCGQAHGDLQASNIAFEKDTHELTLFDFDNWYSQSEKDEDIETGTRSDVRNIGVMPGTGKIQATEDTLDIGEVFTDMYKFSMKPEDITLYIFKKFKDFLSTFMICQFGKGKNNKKRDIHVEWCKKTAEFQSEYHEQNSVAGCEKLEYKYIGQGST